MARARIGYGSQLTEYPQNYAALLAARVLMTFYMEAIARICKQNRPAGAATPGRS